MPNHIHAIIILNGNADTAETHGRASVHDDGQMPYRRPKSISSFVAGFKSAVVSVIDSFIDAQALDIPKYNRINKFWQSNYHDHIIRNQPEYYRIAKYIGENPLKWDQDKYSE